MEEDGNQLKITCKGCNGFVTCSGRSGELLYFNFLVAEISTLALYPEYILQENFYFQWPSISKIQDMYQKLLKGVNGNHKYLRCPDPRENYFEVMRPSIALINVDLLSEETFRAKPT